MQDWIQDWRSLKNISEKTLIKQTTPRVLAGRSKSGSDTAQVLQKPSCENDKRKYNSYKYSASHTHTHTVLISRSFSSPLWFPTGRLTLMLITYLPLFIQQFCSSAQESSIALFHPQI